MPKARPDPELRERARAFVESCGGNLSLAASRLAVDYDFLWRFIGTGRALSPNRLKLQAGLAAQEALARRSHSTNLRDIVRTSESLSLTRAVLTDLLGALDALQEGGTPPQEAGQ